MMTDIYYWNIFFLFENEATIETNFNSQNQAASIRSLFGYVRDGMRWPFYVSYNCYWGYQLLWTPQNN